MAENQQISPTDPISGIRIRIGKVSMDHSRCFQGYWPRIFLLDHCKNPQYELELDFPKELTSDHWVYDTIICGVNVSDFPLAGYNIEFCKELVTDDMMDMIHREGLSHRVTKRINALYALQGEKCGWLYELGQALSREGFIHHFPQDLSDLLYRQSQVGSMMPLQQPPTTTFTQQRVVPDSLSSCAGLKQSTLDNLFPLVHFIEQGGLSDEEIRCVVPTISGLELQPNNFKV